MRPVAFDYVAPATLDEALQALAEGGDDATVISGGQSLLPVLRMRMAAPDVVVDLRKIEGLRGVRDEGDALVIGARTTHHEVAGDPLIRQHAGVLAEAARTIGDAQIRYLGTFGGSLAHADPAGDMGPALLALDGSVDIAGPSGTRTVSARDFFVDYFTTALDEGEVLTSIRVPKHDGWGFAYEKFTLVAQSWAVVAVGAAVRVAEGKVAEARIAMANMGSTAVRSSAAEAALVGTELDVEALKAAASVAGEGTNPPEDAAGTTAYRRHLAGVLAGRAVVRAVGLA